MIQVYVLVHVERWITIPKRVYEAMELRRGQWLRISALDDQRAVLEPAPDRRARFSGVDRSGRRRKWDLGLMAASRTWRHPKKDVHKALRYAEGRGWTVMQTRAGHRWGYARCPEAGPERCDVSVHSTPGNPTDHAMEIRRRVDRCPHRKESR